MDSPTPMIRARHQLSMASHRRVVVHQAKSFCFTVVLICTLFCLAACGPCSIDGMPSVVECDAWDSYSDNCNAGFQDVYVGDVNSQYASGMAHLSLDNICGDLNVFCFPSTLPGFSPEERNPESTVLELSPEQRNATVHTGSPQVMDNLSWSLDSGMFKLLSGQVVSCSLNSQEGIPDVSALQTCGANQNHISSCGGTFHNQKIPSSNSKENSEMAKSGFLDGSLSPYVEISPPVLDWGQKYLYFPSFTFLKVANTHSESMLYLYEPFSTNTQFYPCNFSEVFLRPGEVASICFVFSPAWLGTSSAHLILQTSSGGFLVQATGFAAESPYGIQPLMGLDVSSNGRWSKNLSLFNPFNETLYVEEVTAWISVCSGNTSHSTKAICRLENFQGSDEREVLNIKEWLDVKSVQVGSPLMAIKPHRNWEIGPGSTETIVDIDSSYNSAGKFFGALCIKLLRPSQDKSDTMMVPLEAELGGESADDLTDFLSVSLKTVVSCDSSETAVVIISLRNGAPHLLNVGNISLVGEGTKLFQIKYMEGLMLFPGTVTQVAVIHYFPLPTGLHNSPSESPGINLNCKLVILTNDSSYPQIEVPCKDIVSICSQSDSYPEYEEQKLGKVENGNARKGSLGRGLHSPSPMKALEEVESDELVLGNWKSQGTASGMSVLENQEVVFPVVLVGNHHSKWISVKNPSQQPVVMQLILNSGEIVDNCGAPDGLLQPSSSSSLVHSESAAPTKYGFSIGESALTEAYVHPYGTASLGPVIFHPSNRCRWRSSALIRNNLSGVEWFSLRGFGGSFSLALFEGSKPVQSLGFDFNLPNPLNFSPENYYYMEETTYTCSQPLVKELYAKNTGDLPLEVRRIEVSGAECGSAGFVVHACKGFYLQPGLSTKILISYQADFSAAIVQRDLELALATGILVIPMKANLSIPMFNMCKKSMFWMRVRKFSIAFLLAAFVMFLVLLCIIPQSTALVSQDYLFKSGKNSVATSGVHCNQNGYRLTVSSKMNGLLRSIGEEETPMLESVNRYPDGHDVDSEKATTTQHHNPSLGNQILNNYSLDSQEEMAFRLAESSTIENTVVQETPKDGKLTVRIGKEKGRKRRKKKVSGTGLSGIFEVSSSQSGNSTPSSPLSPVTSFTLPKRLWPLSSDADQPVEARNQVEQVAEQQHEKSSGAEPASKANLLDPEVSIKNSNENCSYNAQEKPSAPTKMAGKPVLLTSATFPCTSRPSPHWMSPSPFLASTSTIAPQARAPGSKLCNQKTVKTEAAKGLDDQFKYDIWGDHLFGLHSLGRSKEVSAMASSATESHSDSFFVRGPQTLVPKSQPKSVSSHQRG